MNEGPWRDRGHPDVNDEELVRRLLARDEAAFAWLIRRYHRSLTRLARTFVSVPAVADEVVQDTWAAFIEGIASFQGRCSLSSWLFTVLANRARSRAVREQRQMTFSAVAEADDTGVPRARFDSRGMWSDPPAPWTAETPDALLEREELRHVLETELDKLPARQRAVLILHDVEGMSPDEICQVLEVSGANQRVLLHRARTALRLAAEEHFRK